MRRVYQRPLALAAFAAAALAAACGRDAAPAPAPVGAAGAAGVDPALLLATRSFHLAPLVAEVGEDLLATELSADGRRAIRLSTRNPGRLLALTPPERDCVAWSALPDGTSLVDCAEPAGDGRRLRRLDAAALDAPLPRPTDVSAETPLAVTKGPPTLWTATAPAGETPARLLATALSPLGTRTIFAAPPGFEIVAVEPASTLALLRRELTPEADEVVLHDWRRSESRLLLPADSDGRFREPRFVDEGRALLLVADDGGDAPRLERLDLATGERARWGRPPCPPRALRVHADGTATVEVDCDGRREALRLDAAGEPLPTPALPAGVRLRDARPLAGEARLAIGTSGERWPAEIAVVDPRDDFRPLTYGLAPRLRAAALAAPRPHRVTSAGAELAAELWPADGSPRALVVWFERREAPAGFGELRPLPAALAADGFAVLVVRGRGGDAPSRRLRRAADGDPAAAALADLRAALAAGAALAPAAAPRLVVGEGPWWGAAALALAASADPGCAAVAVLTPDPDPLAESAASAAAGEPLRSFLLAKWGEPGATAEARRSEWIAAAERVRVPAWAALDTARPESGESGARWQAVAAAGVPLTIVSTRLRVASPRLPGALERELLRFLREQAPRAAR